MVHDYIGHPLQCSGIEECRLCGGKGDQMPIYEVRNGKGLSFTVFPQRCLDIGRLSFKGLNCSFLSPAGYTAPYYFREEGKEFLKSFTCGFLTTCGLQNVGPAGKEGGETFGLHGSISNTPAEFVSCTQTGESLEIQGMIRDERIFGCKLQLKRRISCSLKENSIEIQDIVENTGDRDAPLMILYHFNTGYPLLSEKAELYIGSKEVRPRDAIAEKGAENWMYVEKPQPGYQEQCFYHRFSGAGKAGIYNQDCDIGFFMEYSTAELPAFTQWKMMGIRDYVMGLEPGNCNPEGRVKLREKGKLDMIKPKEKKNYKIRFVFFDEYHIWKENKIGRC